MDNLISLLMTEILIGPIIFIMVTGILLVPFATPLACAGWIFGNLSGRVAVLKAPISFFLALYGLVLTVGIWFVNPSREAIEAVAGAPVPALGIPLLILLLALFEQYRLSLPRFWKRAGWISSALAGVALYWMALAATMSAAV